MPRSGAPQPEEAEAAGGGGGAAAPPPPPAQPPAAPPRAAAPDIKNYSTTVPADAQACPARLAAVYDGMAARFLEAGLNTAAIAALESYFHHPPAVAAPRPRRYADFPSPLAPDAVRLCVLYLQRAAAGLAADVAAAAAGVRAALPAAHAAHLAEPRDLHATVFMMSQPQAPRPDPFCGATGGVPAGGGPHPARWAPAPGVLERERAACRAAAAAAGPPRLRVHRLLLADSGTLLLCCVDETGRLAALRGRLAAAFPGAPRAQPTIVHMSLGRLLTAAPLDALERARVAAACDAATARLAGRVLEPAAMHHVCEETFAVVDGHAVELPFGDGGG